MKFIYLSPIIVNSIIINNHKLPACANCKFFEPSKYGEFNSASGICMFFGEKNIVTNEITYSYAELSRNNENKCGINGTYFESESNLDSKILKHKLKQQLLPITLYSFLTILLIVKLSFMM
jgi:hypothetical protein